MLLFTFKFLIIYFLFTSTFSINIDIIANLDLLKLLDETHCSYEINLKNEIIQSFNQFRTDFKRFYADESELSRKLNIFARNYAKMKPLLKDSYTNTKFSDQSSDEFNSFKGHKITNMVQINHLTNKQFEIERNDDDIDAFKRVSSIKSTKTSLRTNGDILFRTQVLFSTIMNDITLTIGGNWLLSFK